MNGLSPKQKTVLQTSKCRLPVTSISTTVSVLWCHECTVYYRLFFLRQSTGASHKIIFLLFFFYAPIIIITLPLPKDFVLCTYWGQESGPGQGKDLWLFTCTHVSYEVLWLVLVVCLMVCVHLWVCVCVRERERGRERGRERERERERQREQERERERDFTELRPTALFRGGTRDSHEFEQARLCLMTHTKRWKTCTLTFEFQTFKHKYKHIVTHKKQLNVTVIK